MALFDPTPFLPIPDTLRILPEHGSSWRKKWPNWWGGATIASPTREMCEPAAQVLQSVRRLALAGNKQALNEFYVKEAEWARRWVRTVLGDPDAVPVLLDASGTAAILTASRIIAHACRQTDRRFWTLTTDEGGSLVPVTLKGRDPNEVDRVMFQPNTSLFYQSEPVIPYPQSVELSNRLLSLAEKDNAEILGEIEEILSGDLEGSGVIVLPHVTKTGRVLPVAEVGALVSRLREGGRKVYLVVDGIQAIGRLSESQMVAPLSYCDVYILGAAKALGGLLTASASVYRRPLLDCFVPAANACADGGASGWFSHFQFAPEWENQLDSRLLKASAISLPECASMRAGLFQFYLRGDGQEFADRRRHCLADTEAKRQVLAKALGSLPDVFVLEPTPGKPLVPSIVCVGFADGITPGAVKEALQGQDPEITPSAPIKRYLRLDIPEYRTMPSIDVLVSALARIIQKQ